MFKDPPRDVLPSLPIIVLFLSTWGKDLLMACKTWIVDGTFKSAPHPFYQVLI